MTRGSSSGAEIGAARAAAALSSRGSGVVQRLLPLTELSLLLVLFIAVAISTAIARRRAGA